MANHRSLEHSYREMRMRLALQNLVEEVELDEVIMNSNSCGQGHDPEHSNHPFHATIMKHGYNYSHSTPIKQKDGATINYHTYKHHANRDKNVSVVKPPGMDQHRWDTSTSGSGRQATQGWHSGTLDRHLKGRKIKPLVNHTDLKEEISEDVIEETMINGHELHPDDQKTVKHSYVHRWTGEHTPHWSKEASTPGPHFKDDADWLHHTKFKVAKSGRLHKGAKWSESSPTWPNHPHLRKEEVEIVTELAPTAPNPMKQKMDAQRQQVEKQKDQLRMQLAQQKAAKQEQAMKQKGEKSLEKIKEDDDTWKHHSKVEHQGKEFHVWSRPHRDGYTAYQLSRMESHRPLTKSGYDSLESLQKKTGVKVKEEVLDERMVHHVRTFDRASKLQKLHAQQYTRLSAGGNLAKAEMHRKRAAEYKRIMYTARDNPDKLPSV